MNVYEALQRLRLDGHGAVIEPGWEKSLRRRPSGTPEWLESRALQQACDYCRMPPEAAREVQRAGRRAAQDEALGALLWHAHCKFSGSTGGPGLSQWPALDAALGQEAGLFYVLVVLSECRRASEFHRARAIPEDVRSDTMSDVVVHMERYRRHTGAYGLPALTAGGWFTNHFRGRLYRLGRLQFMHRTFAPQLTAFRRGDGCVRALAAAGTLFRRDGQRNGAAGITETEGTWTSTFEVDPACVRGHRIDPVRARAERDTIPLNRAEWRPALCGGDPVLDIHIPAIGPMTPEACEESAARAVEFFPRHFPDCAPARALVCNTWMLDPQLTAWLPESSNIAQFQRRFYLHPVETDAWAALRFVFELDVPYGSTKAPDTDGLPRKTSLERALLDHAAGGGRFYKAGGFILTEDLPWGRSLYGQGG